MTEKDYELIAGALYEARAVPKPPQVKNWVKAKQWQQWNVIDTLAYKLHCDNPSFDIDKFKTYCNKGTY